MRKTWMLTLVLAFSAAWAAAQTYPNSSSPQTSTQTSQTSTDSSTSVQGCLSGSNGSFTLTDNSGTTYQLAGDTSKLSEHVGHKVEIKGTTSSSSAGSASDSHKAAGGGAQPTLTVTSMKHIATSCSPGH